MQQEPLTTPAILVYIVTVPGASAGVLPVNPSAIIGSGVPAAVIQVGREAAGAPPTPDNQLDLLTLEQASLLTHYSVEYLGQLVREGHIPNAGRPNRPRIARKDLWVKGPRRKSAGESAPKADLSGLVQDIINGKD